ncbi:MAG TPA: hypothetical protein VIS96_01185 [Terrimicrobiaceae bacterium]
MQVPMGQKVSWKQLTRRNGAEEDFIQERGVSVATRPSRRRPIPNEGSGELKTFIETAYTVYKADPQWWRVTLDWFAFALENPIVEVAGLIHSILLDRLTSKEFYKSDCPAQIDAHLPIVLKSGSQERIKIEASLTEIFRAVAPGWTPERSHDISEAVIRWNNEPKYKLKIAAVFDNLGLPRPDNKTLANRGRLAHAGELWANADPASFHLQIGRHITMLCLSP